VASYNSSRFLILLGTSDEDDDDGVGDDPGVFLLLNTGDLCSSKQHYIPSPSSLCSFINQCSAVAIS
jgi:hypothetical protein